MGDGFMVRTERIIVQSNNRAAWQRAWADFEECAKEETQFVFEVEIADDLSIEEGDITNLKYFCPIANEMDNNMCEYMLKIFINGDFRKTIERIRIFMYKIFEELYVDFEENSVIVFSKGYVDNELKLVGYEHEKEKIIENNILNPIIHSIIKQYVMKTDKNAEKKNNIITKVFESIVMQKKENAKNERILIITNLNSFDMFEQIKNSINQNATLQQYVKDYNYKFKYIVCMKTKMEASDILPILKVENPEKMDFSDSIECFDKYLKNSKHYRGIKKKRLSDEQKQELAEKLYKKVNKISKNANALENIILRLLLKNFVERKEILNLQSDNIEINESVLEKISADAKSYAEGLYQILENAYLYSAGKCAFIGIRIHNADKNAPMSNYDDEAQNRIRLYKKYSDCLLKNQNNSTNTNNIFNDDNYSDFIEFYVLDNATDKIGIVPNYNQQNNDVASIRDIIELTEEQYGKSKEAVEEYYIKHYGLRWFTKIVDKNRGGIKILSPNGKLRPSYYCSDRSDMFTNDDVTAENVYSTEYSVIIPLSYVWDNCDVKIQMETQHLFGDKISPEDYNFTAIRMSNFKPDDSKTEQIHKIYNLIKSYETNMLLLIMNNNYNIRSIEVLAKAIFLCIYRTYCKDSERELYFALDFNNQTGLIHEFVRVFSIFYDKADKNKYMAGVQIALASKGRTSKDKEINFIIAGEHLKSAYAIANIFTYYNSESTVPFIPLLKYLTVDDMSGIDVAGLKVSQFPFDLYLKTQTDGNNWFLNRMNNALNSEIRNKPYGCKISDIHIRVSSRLHVNNFYEGELLFHNIGNVYRFAYIIAKQIIKNIETQKHKKSIMLLGYENYSSILIQQIAFWIRNAVDETKQQVYGAIITTTEEGGNQIYYLEDKNRKFNDLEIICYTVIPIGTTMSTVYKIHNVFTRDFGAKCEFGENYSIIAVSNCLHEKKDFAEGSVESRYWKLLEHENKIIHLMPEKAGTEGIDVRYLLTADSTWHDVTTCELCSKNIPLIQVDRTSTLPNAIFELSENKRKFFDSSFYVSKLAHFKPTLSNDMELSECVKYSHLYRGNNHYQFYFDFDTYVNKAEKRIVQWAKGIKLDGNAFNIVLSPLSATNSRFLKIIIDNVFSSSLRFLHIDITNTYKEDARAKFSYIAQEYANIKKLNNDTDINFYYIDDSIVTGQTIARGRMLLKMLIDESGLKCEKQLDFKKIFLLINRSSYDTINALVENADENFHAYLNIHIPSYNTNNNFCPGCNIRKKQELLRKRSATEALSREFSRLFVKHEMRTPEEYEKWLMEEIRYSHSYFSWLKSWLYSYSGRDNPSMKNRVKIFVEGLRQNVANYVKEMAKSVKTCDTETFLLQVGNLTIDSFLKHERNGQDYDRKVINLMRYIVAQRAYLRLETMDNAYKELQGIAQQVNEYKENQLKKMTSAKIFELIKDADIERLISYIKVISREQLSNYYHVRCAIVSIMIQMLDEVIGYSSKSEKMEPIIKKIEESTEEQQYELLATIIHRLAILQSAAVLQPERIKKVIAFYGNILEKFSVALSNDKEKKERALLTEIPTKVQMIEKYMKSIKTATMLNNDDSLCKKIFHLEDLK